MPVTPIKDVPILDEATKRIMDNMMRIRARESQGLITAQQATQQIQVEQQELERMKT